MSTATTERPAPAASPPAPSAARARSRFARWLASWRVSLRMAGRDVRRYRGRSILVLVMVALPLALIVAGIVWAASGSLSAKDRIPFTMGPGAAVLYGPGERQVQQGLEGNSNYSNEQGPATPIPGYDSQGPLAERAAAIGALAGGEVIPVAAGDFRWTSGKRHPYGTALFVADPGRLAPRFELISGRWPSDNSEVVVTPAGLDEGMPESGLFEIRVGDQARTVTVVGQAKGYQPYGGMAGLVTTESWTPALTWDLNWVLLRDQPVRWPEVTSLNAYGLGVDSREVLTNPPADLGLPQDYYDQEAAQTRSLRTGAALAGTSLFVITALLVGPAFAVSAGRQRRALALAASNGAETRQLRRTVLAQALLLGVMGVLIGAALGAAAIAAGLVVWQRLHPATTLGLFDLPPLPVAIVCACGVLAALTAALIPSMRLGRLDIVGVMKGQNVSPRLNRVVPVAGLVLFLLGIAGLYIAVTRDRTSAGIGGVLGLIVGSLMFIPLLLVGAGRLAGRFPVAVRMATRDSARQRHRAVPTVAALMAGAALLATFAVALASDTAHQARTYQPQAPAGEGYAYVGASDLRDLQDTIAANAPTWVTSVDRSAGFEWPEGMTSEPTKLPFVASLAAGCSLAQSLPDPLSDSASNACLGFTSEGGNMQGAIAVWPAAEIVRRLHLDPTEAAAVRSGVVLVAPTRQQILTGGTLTMVSGTFARDADSGALRDITSGSQVTLPALPLPADTFDRGALDAQFGLVVSLEKATELGWSLRTERLSFHDPGGAITAERQKAVSEFMLYDGQLYVERGFQREDAKIMLGVFALAVFLLTTVTLISTSLALAEQQSDMATLAAVGATKGTRRRFAAAQAGTVALIGSALGILIGIIAGIAISYPLTAHTWDPVTGAQLTLTPTVHIPVLNLLSVLAGVPLLAALIAAVAIRRAPAVTRRAT